MNKRCEVCGKFMHASLHGACKKCLSDIKKLPIPLQELELVAQRMSPHQRRSIRGLLRALLTIVNDGNWYCHKWDPLHIINVNLQTKEARPYLTQSRIDAIHQLLQEAKDNGKV
jgi:hypothetical protein